MNIQETITYELTYEEIRSAIYDAFVRKLIGLNKNIPFDYDDIQVDEYGYAATLTITENSEI